MIVSWAPVLIFFLWFSLYEVCDSWGSICDPFKADATAVLLYKTILALLPLAFYSLDLLFYELFWVRVFKFIFNWGPDPVLVHWSLGSLTQRPNFSRLRCFKKSCSNLNSNFENLGLMKRAWSLLIFVLFEDSETFSTFELAGLLVPCEIIKFYTWFYMSITAFVSLICL